MYQCSLIASLKDWKIGPSVIVKVTLDSNLVPRKTCETSKGQLISKWFFGVLDFLLPKHQRKQVDLRYVCIIVVKSNSFVRFLEEIEDIKNHFDINWPIKKQIGKHLYWIRYQVRASEFLISLLIALDILVQVNDFQKVRLPWFEWKFLAWLCKYWHYLQSKSCLQISFRSHTKYIVS